jgi:hypothetical protein
MTEKATRDPLAYYESKGLKRHMIVVKPETQEKLKVLAKQQGIMQGEIIDVILKEADMELFEGGFAAVRASKNSERAASPKAVIKDKLKEASPEQLAQIERILAGNL